MDGKKQITSHKYEYKCTCGHVISYETDMNVPDKLKCSSCGLMIRRQDK